MRRKKGQGGSSAAILVMVIAAFIILYILFLPPEDRADLLDEDTDSDDDEDVEDDEEVVLDESPGTIFKETDREFQHKLPSVNLFKSKEDKVLKELQSVFVETSRSEQTTKTMALITDPSTENAQLSLTVNDHKGRLIIMLNDDELFNGEVTDVFAPINLGILQEENVLEFRASPVGPLNFFSSNFYDLRNVKITGTVENADNSDAENNFLVSREEAGNIEEAHLIYFVECTIRDVGRLRITLNEVLLSSSVPDCGSPVRLNVDPDDIVEGRNTVRFSAESGKYLIDQVSVNTELEKPIFPIYFFDVNETQFDRIENGSMKAELRIHMVDDDERKAANLNINNRRTSFDQRDFNYTKDITRFIEDGNNFVRIEPRTTLHIVDLEVELLKD